MDRKTLYIGNLPWSVTTEDLEQAFAQQASQVFSARIATDRETGRSRGFGFVEVPAEEAQKLIDTMNGWEWGGRIITVNEALPRPERAPRR